MPIRIGSPGKRSRSAWRDYEDQIYDRLKAMAGSAAEVKFNQRILGKFSGVHRQVDAMVIGAFAGGVVAEQTVAVDCKCFSRKVHVKDVEAFLGQLDDLGADIGLMVTTEGYTKAASGRVAGGRGIRLDIVPYEDLSDWSPWHLCDFCNSPDEDWHGVVWFDRVPKVDGPVGGEYVRSVGWCDRCNSLHVQCACGAITGHPGNEGEWMECEGGCGIEWKLEVERDKKGEPVGTIWEQLEFRKGSVS